MNPGDDIPMVEVEQSMALSPVRESQLLTPSHEKESGGIPFTVRESLPVTASPGSGSQEIRSAVGESQSVTPSAARGYLENPSAVKEGQSVSTSPLSETPQNPSAVNEGQSAIPSARTTQENPQAGISIKSGGGESSGASPSAFNQLVVYDPDSANNRQGGNESDVHAAPGSSAPPGSFEQFSAFSVQCNHCFKRRLVPTKDQYEKIRATVRETPFVCSRASEWNRVVSCADPADIIQDDSRLWAIDKPNIPVSPQGWERLIRLRGAGGTKFADVFYVTPTGKKLRSTLDVQMYLIKHSIQGVHISQFCFKAPKPLRADYIRKQYQPRPRAPASVDPISVAPPPAGAQEEGVSSVTPLSEAPPSAVAQVGQASSVTPISQAPPSAVAQVEGALSVTPISQAPPSAIARGKRGSSATRIPRARPSAAAPVKRASSATPISRAPPVKRASSVTPISQAPPYAVAQVIGASSVTAVSRAPPPAVPQVVGASTVTPISWAPPPAVASSMTPTYWAPPPAAAQKKRKSAGASTSRAPPTARGRRAPSVIPPISSARRAPSVTPVSRAPPPAVAQEEHASSPSRSSSATLSMPSSPARSSSATLSMPSSPASSSSATPSMPSSPARSSSATLSMPSSPARSSSATLSM